MANKVSFIIQLKDQFRRNATAIRRQFKGIEDSAKRASGEIKKFSARTKKAFIDLKKNAGIAGAAMTAGITMPFVRAGSSMIQFASDAEETANKFNQVFDDVRSDANAVAREFSSSFGTANSTAQKLIGNTGDLLVGFGFTGAAALDLSRRVNELAADLTSFQNVEEGISSASERLTKALLGETESAKSLGIVIRQNTAEFRTNVRITARALGISEQQAKAIVILQQAQEQSRKAVGDVSRTWGDYANVVRRADEKTREMKESFGRLLLPIATKLVIKITQLVDWVNSLSPGMKQLILMVGAFVAIVGPLLLVVGAIGAAFAFIGAKVAIVTAAIGGVIVLLGALAAKWESVKSFFGGISSFFANASVSPLGVPVVRGGTVDGNITVSAAPGSTVESTSMSTSGEGLNIGMNMATAR